MADPAERLTEALAGRYRIERELGQGGMATVYLAHDVRHDREVAIKVLHPDLGAVLGADRFLGEIKTTARLQHPHILPLLDSGEAGGLLFYVMPYVRGETLRTRLERERQLPIDDAVRIAREVADALGAAHAEGIIHRDIKPENILLQGGHALVADFGIALAVQHAGGARMTQTGLSLGTPQYMSPEQAMGERSIEARSDIYSLGAVTYEMLAGDPPFTGSSVQAIVAKVLNERPTPLRTLRDTVPIHVENAVHTALAKLPADRFATAHDFAATLAGDRHSTMGAAVSAAGQPHSRRGRFSVVALGLLALASLVAAVWGWTRRPPVADLPVQRFEFTTSADLPFAFPMLSSVAALGISPAGDRVVYSVKKGGTWVLAIRNLEQLIPRVLPGTEGAFYPEFSPDGRWIAFETGGTLRKIRTDGSGLTTIAATGASTGTAGLTWLSNDEIVFGYRAISGSPGLWRVSASGGSPKSFSSLDSASGERIQLAPRALDGGRFVLYTGTRGTALLLHLGLVDGRTGKATVFPGLNVARALGLVGDKLVYVRGDGALMMVPFDPERRSIGTPFQVGDSIAVRNWDAGAALSPSGALVYQRGGVASQLVRTDLSGKETVLVDSVRPYQHPRFSPDGTRIAFGVTGTAGFDIWTYDLGSRALERLTSDGGNDRPEWSADGRRVGYASSRETPQGFWWQPFDGSGPASRLQLDSFPIREGVFTRDGKGLLYRTDHAINSRDIWLRPLTGDSTPIPLLVSINDEKEPRPSPDSRWLAYVSNESGREEVYVRSLAPGGGRVPVSAGGGGEPLWAPHGMTVYYRDGEQVIEATLTSTPSLRVLGRRVLFSGPFATDVFHANYDVSPDGKSFLMVKTVDQSRGLVMVVNWAAELRRRAGQ